MNEQERRTLGQRVERARTTRGWSKERLAEEASITTTTLRRIEDGLRVQDAKLQTALDALGLNRGEEAPDRYSEDQMHPLVFELPPEIERGYENTVRFVRAVSENVPVLSPRATQLGLDAARLFSDAGQIILDRKGGDGDVDADRRDSAPLSEPAPGPAEQPGKEFVINTEVDEVVFDEETVGE